MSGPGIDPGRLAAWREAEAALDPGGMRERIAGLPDQLAEAVRRAAPFAGDLDLGRRSAIAVAGMGGSAIGADLAAAYALDRRRLPFATVRGYALPRWIDGDAVLVASSYSGNTEETLAVREAAVERGIPVVAVTTGGRLGEAARTAGDPLLTLPPGFPPRAALGWSLAAVSLIAARLDPGLDVDDEAAALEAAAAFLARAGRGWLEWEVENPALDLAAAAAGRMPAFYGGHPVSAAAALRWKCQWEENAKTLAISGALPEHNHNEIVGLDGGQPFLASILPVWLETPWDHPRVARRFAFLRGWAAGRVVGQRRVTASGETPLEGMLWLCWLGDCASFLASVIGGHDPTPVTPIDQLKAELSESRE